MDNCDKCSAQIKTSMKLLKHIAEYQKRGKKEKLHCDDYDSVAKQRKTLKHMNKSPMLKTQFQAIHSIS